MMLPQSQKYEQRQGNGAIVDWAWLPPGDMRERLARFNWDDSPLGQPSGWCTTLKTAVSLCLSISEPLAIWWGAEALCLCNEAYLERTPAAAAALGKPVRQLWPELWPDLSELLQRTRSTQRPQRGEMHERGADTSGFILNPLFDDDGQVVGVVCSHPAQGGTDGWRKVRALFELSTIGIVCCEPSGRFFDANDAYLRIIGYDRLDIQKGLCWTDVTPAEYLPLDRQALAQVSTCGRSEPYEKAYLRKDGEIAYVVIGLAQLDTQGNIIAYVVDITEHKRTEAAFRTALQESETDFRTMANSIPQLAWMTDASGSIFWYNQRWFDYTGTTEESVRGWGWVCVHHPDHVQRVLERFKHHIETGEAWEDTFPLRRHDGVWRWFLSRAEPVRDARGQVLRWFGSNTDITENLETEAALNEAVRARDMFLSIASHELNTPLTSLKLQVQGAMRKLREGRLDALQPERILRLLEQTDRHVARLARLVADMLDIAQLRSGSVALKRTHFDLAYLVSEVVERLMPQYQEAGAPPPTLDCEACLGFWDRGKLEQVLTNLLINALRYGRRQPVSVVLRGTPHKVSLAVQDHGVGIPPESRERIFHRFERAISASEVSGLGLGLYISRKLVLAHGGTLSVESQVGVGSVFCVELPRG